MSTFLETLKGAFSMRRAGRVELPEVLERLACAAVERGLETPALIAVESAAPLSFLGSQAGHALSPFARLLGLGDSLPSIALALEDRRTLRALADRIEELASAKALEPMR